MELIRNKRESRKESAGFSFTKPIDKSIYREILDFNQARMDKTALRFLGKEVTFAALYKQTDLVADLLYSHGLRKGDTILTCVNGTPQTVSLLLACSKLGITAMMLTPRTSDEQLSYAVYDLKIKYMFLTAAFFPLFVSMKATDDLKEVIIMPIDKTIGEDSNEEKKLSGASNVIRWSEFIDSPVTDEAVEAFGGDNVLAACSTTGSTGIPKFMLHTNKSYVALAHVCQEIWPEWKPGDLLFSIVPTFVATGISLVLLCPLALGLPILQEPRLNPFETFITNLTTYHPRIVLATKSIWMSMAEMLREKKFDLSSITHAFTVGEVISEKELETVDGFLSHNGSPARLENMYGMSECNSILTYHFKGQKMGTSAGRAIPGAQVQVFDYSTHKECGPGEIGEVFFQTPMVMKEYMFNPKANQEFFIKDNLGETWGRTNDIGYILENGEIVICCRSKELFTNEKGESIFPFLIERVLVKDENVRRCKALGMVYQGHPALSVHLCLNHPEDPASLVKRLEAKLKSDKDVNILPDLYKIRDFFPISEAGKIDMVKMKAETDGFLMP